MEAAAERDTLDLFVAAIRAGESRKLVVSQILTETRGNPLALLELPRGLTPQELAGRLALGGVC